MGASIQKEKSGLSISLDDEPGELIEVAPVVPLRRLFTYRMTVRSDLEIGCRLRVPFGKRQIVAYFVGPGSLPEGVQAKDVSEQIDQNSLISPQLMAMAHFMADYYGSSLGETLDAFLPAGVRHDQQGRQIFHYFPATDPVTLRQEIEMRLKRAPAQARILEELLHDASGLERQQLLKRAGSSLAPLNALVGEALVQKKAQNHCADPLLMENVTPSVALKLNLEQQAAMAAIEEAFGQSKVLLLHGVTGSGKTEVYLQAIAKVVSKGQQALVLVPEIALTPQTLRRFRSRFEQVAVLHSGMSDADRHQQWRKAQSGECQVMVGTRSALFAPLNHLGLIVVDEEHDASFKQTSNPRYQARDMAVWLARQRNIPIVLGSATPALESWHNAQAGRYQLIQMKERAGEARRAPIEVIDMVGEERRDRKIPLLSKRLTIRLEHVLSRGEQAILLFNKRGFAAAQTCQSCRSTVRCPHCVVPLTWHKGRERLLCHYCRYRISLYKQCPTCHGHNLQLRGAGSEKLEDVLKERFPQARIGRMDTDTMKGRDAHRRLLDRFANGDLDLLVGTQMVAKGLDFPRVTLVGVLGTDYQLNLPDFRSGERVFQLITQVSGRAGRWELPGHVVVQTFNPEHPAIQHAVSADVEQFYKEELESRQLTSFPPYTRLVRLLMLSHKDDTVGHLQKVGQALQQKFSGLSLLGPAPAPLSYLEGKYRAHLLVQGLGASRLKEFHDALAEGPRLNRGQRLTVDVDPISLL